MAYNDNIEFNVAGSDFTPYKFNKKGIIRRMNIESNTVDCYVYETVISHTCSEGDEQRVYSIYFDSILETNKDILNKAKSFSIDIASSTVASEWSSYPIIWSDFNAQYIYCYTQINLKRIILVTKGNWEYFTANIYLNAYVPV